MAEMYEIGPEIVGNIGDLGVDPKYPDSPADAASFDRTMHIGPAAPNNEHPVTYVDLRDRPDTSHPGYPYARRTVSVTVTQAGKLNIAYTLAGVARDWMYYTGEPAIGTVIVTAPGKPDEQPGPFPMHYGQIGASGPSKRRYPRPPA